VDGRVVFRVESFQFRMQGLVAGAGQAGIAFIDLDAGISLALGRKGIGGSCTYLRYIPFRTGFSAVSAIDLIGFTGSVLEPLFTHGEKGSG
jgi:hypothetical protein